MENNYILALHKEKFICRTCKIPTRHDWYKSEIQKHPNHDRILMRVVPKDTINPNYEELVYPNKSEIHISICRECLQYTIWKEHEMIYPTDVIGVPEPEADMFEDVKEIYNEARNVFPHSPRASAALLRLSLERLLPQLEEFELKKESLNNMIANMVTKGIPEYIQKALDTVRIYGNDSIHSGQIVLEEKDENVIFLFELVNLLFREFVIRKREIERIYASLPTGPRQATEKRNERAKMNQPS